MRKKIAALLAALTFLGGVEFVSDAHANKVVNVEFEELPLPKPEEEGQMRFTKSATVYYKDGTSKKVSLSYHDLYKTGDKDAQGNFAGMFLDMNRNPIRFADGSIRFSVQPDASAFFFRNGKYYHMQHFENAPGMVYYTELAVNPDGTLKPVRYQNIDFGPVKGTVINCSAQKSPWDTFLSAEEDYYFAAYWFDPKAAPYVAQHVNYCEKDANGFLNGRYKAPSFAPTADYSWWCSDFVKPLLTDYLKVKPQDFQPYNYGYIVEIGVDKEGKPFISKNRKLFTLGKFTPEVAVVMPDNRTVYMLDDGSYTGMFMFIASKPKDLTEGTLYAAKLTQVSKDDTDGGEFKVDWVPLGFTDSKTLDEYINVRKVSLSDIFDIADPKNCPKDFTKVFNYETGKDGMCIRLKDGTKGSKISPKFKDAYEVHTAAAFLEPRKYGSINGATMEFSKGEGITYDWDQDVVYFAISRIEESMLKGADRGTMVGQDHIRLKDNRCGAVYKGTFGPGVDIHGNNLFSSYIVRHLKAEIIGVPATDKDPGADKNACRLDSVANPDNIMYMGANQLFIAEDSAHHYNNAAWAYNTKTKKLTRIGTVPPGAEVTGAFGSIVINGTLYFAFNAQHPYGESRRNAAGATVLRSEFNDARSALTQEKYKAIVGYVKGLPPLK